MLPAPGGQRLVIAKLLGVSVGTLYNYIPDLREFRASRLPTQPTSQVGRPLTHFRV